MRTSVISIHNRWLNYVGCRLLPKQVFSWLWWDSKGMVELQRRLWNPEKSRKYHVHHVLGLSSTSWSFYTSIVNFPDTAMEVKTILIILALNIILPTLDIVTDINLVYKLYRRAHFCDLKGYGNCLGNCDDYKKCLDNPDSYCSNNENYQNICRFSSHPKMATLMLIPFLLNYFVCFITFFWKEKNKKFTFIFALLNIYPQFGMDNH